MASEINVKREDDLPDLEGEIDESNAFEATENVSNEIGISEYQASNQVENAELINSMIVEGDSESAYIADVEGPPEQQFLTISQGNSQIGDNGSIVYTDSSFMDTMSEQLEPKAETQEDGTEENTMYYQVAEDIDSNYLQGNAELIQQVVDGDITFADGSDHTLVFQNESDAQVVDESVLQQVVQQGEPITLESLGSGVTFLNKSDLKNLVAIQQEPRGIKRALAPTPSKPVFAKVFVQNANKSSTQKVVSGNLAKRKISLAEAQRAGIINPKIHQLLTSPGGPARVVVKKVLPSSGSSVLGKSPAKILPAPAPQERVVVRTHPVRTTVPMSTLKTLFSTTTAPARPINLNKTLGNVTVVKGSPQKVYLSNVGGKLRIPVQVAGKQQVQYVKLVNNSNTSGLTVVKQAGKAVSSPVLIQKPEVAAGKRILIQADSQTSPNNSLPLTFKGKTYATAIAQVKEEKETDEASKTDDKNEIIEDNIPNPELDENLENDDELMELNPESPQRLLEANGIRPKKPCNCTRSQCLKLYCECFANGEFCFECNCNNCFNNIEHEEERQMSIKSCLERNPSAFRPKIQVPADSDEEERRTSRGCNCKRSYCLKNYCECFEGKVKCDKFCKCVGCRNTEEGVWMRTGEASGEDEKEGEGKGTPYLPPALAEALCHCILAQAEEADRKGEDMITTEQRIIEELGQRLVQIIGNRSKRDSR